MFSMGEEAEAAIPTQVVLQVKHHEENLRVEYLLKALTCASLRRQKGDPLVMDPL